MAIITRDIGGDPGPGNVLFQIDYNDVSLRITAVRCINNSALPAWGAAIQELEPDPQSQRGRMYQATFPANQTTEIAVPTSNQQKLQYTIDAASGRIDGVTFTYTIPA